jgi:hypothetical protein
MMSDPCKFLPLAVKEEIKARTSSGKKFSAEELHALISIAVQERLQKDEKKKVEKEETRKKRRKSTLASASASASASPRPLTSPPPSSSKEESKPLSSSVAKGKARSEATVTVEPQADPVEEATSQKKETEEGEPATKKPRLTSIVQRDLSSSEESSSDESKVAKNSKHGSKVVKKELPKSMSSRKKERSLKGQKQYKEDDDQYGHEVEVTGSRKLVEVYQEDFDDKLTDDADHKSL